jgi:hypothetical protein
VTKSGLADSPFFAPPAGPRQASPPPEIDPPIQKETHEKEAVEEGLTERRQANQQAIMQASKEASINANMQASIIALIRKALKYAGKESATYRFTPEEKKALLQLTFSYKIQGFKTHENELVRIAVNFLLEDHKQNGRNSILETVLQAPKE